jgi:hypothetical protein
LPKGEHGLQCTEDCVGQYHTGLPSMRLGEEPHIFQIDRDPAQVMLLLSIIYDHINLDYCDP